MIFHANFTKGFHFLVINLRQCLPEKNFEDIILDKNVYNRKIN